MRKAAQNWLVAICDDRPLTRDRASASMPLLRPFVQFGFQFQNDVAEQTRRERVGRLLLKHPIALQLMPALFAFAVSHGEVPPCSDPQRGGIGRLKCEIIAARQLRALLHVTLAIDGKDDRLRAILQRTIVSLAAPAVPLEKRDELGMYQQRALACCLSMIFSENRFAFLPTCSSAVSARAKAAFRAACLALAPTAAD